MVGGYIKASFCSYALPGYSFSDAKIKVVRDFPAVAGSISRLSSGDIREVFLLYYVVKSASSRGDES